MMNVHTTFRESLAQQRGSALILTVLILLVLSALGMLAMRDVGRSLQQSGAYRVRTQANGMSEAASSYTAFLAGRDASGFWTMMQKPQTASLSSLTSQSARHSAERRGAFVKFTQERKDTSLPTTPASIFPSLNYEEDETGILGSESLEVREAHSEFEVVLRDPMDGPSAPGYGEGYCFKKVTIASRATLGKKTADWSGSGMVADKRNAIETYIGPIECGAH